MPFLALYIPKPQQLIEPIVALLLAFIALCFVTYRMKLPMATSGLTLLLGACFGMTGIAFAAWSNPSSTYGYARAFTNADFSDSFLTFIALMSVGPGKLIIFLSMVACWAVYIAFRRVNRRQKGELQPVNSRQM